MAGLEMAELLGTLDALPGIRPYRACASFENPTDDDDRHWFDVALELDHEDGRPTSDAWQSLTLLAYWIGTLSIAGRRVELMIDGGQRPGQPRELFFTLQGELDDIEPSELASWMRDLARVDAA